MYCCHPLKTNDSVSSRMRKVIRDDADITSGGRPFHTWGPAGENARLDHMQLLARDVNAVAVVVVGGRSRLHLVDLGGCSRTRDGSSLSLTSLGAVITSLLSGQRQLPHRSAVACFHLFLFFVANFRE